MEHFDKKSIDAKIAARLPFSHPWHNRFHLEMPFGLINDPNGLIAQDGLYHIFFQWNPLGCAHKNKCWGHTATRDFVHYELPRLALWPSDAHDKDGCYSGCACAQEAEGGLSLRVLYTCNAKNDGVRTPAQRFGTLRADGTIEKGEIVIADSPAGITGHFRDPYLFTRKVGGVERRFLIIGAQADEDPPRGTVLVYEEGAAGWKSLGELRTRLGEGRPFGYMWECPNLLSFGSYDALLFCPQGLAARAFDRQNLYQAGYIVGHLSLDSMEMIGHTKFRELDRGFDFYAPQVFSSEGRHILIGWMGMPDRDADYPTRDLAGDGWVFSLTLPRMLTLVQGRLCSWPIRELEALRIEETAIELEQDGTAQVCAPLFAGSELLLNVWYGSARKVTLTISYGAEQLVFSYDRKAQIMTIDRTGMVLGGRGVRRFPLFADGSLALRLYVDKTAVEAFFQHGEEAASLLVFPKEDVRPKMTLAADAPMHAAGRIWELDAIRFCAGRIGGVADSRSDSRS